MSNPFSNLSAASDSLPTVASDDAGKTPDPVLILYGRFLQLHKQSHAVSERARALRRVLVERHGEAQKGQSCGDLWADDPDDRRLRVLNAASNQLSNLSTEVAMAMLAFPTSSIPGALAKVRYALWSLPWNDEPVDIDEQRARSALEAAESVLALMAPDLEPISEWRKAKDARDALVGEAVA